MVSNETRHVGRKIFVFYHRFLFCFFYILIDAWHPEHAYSRWWSELPSSPEFASFFADPEDYRIACDIPYQTALSGAKSERKIEFFRLPARRRRANSMHFPDWSGLITATVKAAPRPILNLSDQTIIALARNRTRFFRAFTWYPPPNVVQNYPLIIHFLSHRLSRRFKIIIIYYLLLKIYLTIKFSRCDF